MKKATTKRERKYGKKKEDIEAEKPKPEIQVRVVVDGASILNFRNKHQADAYIKKQRDEAKAKNRMPTSYVFL